MKSFNWIVAVCLVLTLALFLASPASACNPAVGAQLVGFDAFGNPIFQRSAGFNAGFGNGFNSFALTGNGFQLGFGATPLGAGNFALSTGAGNAAININAGLGRRGFGARGFRRFR